MLTSALRSQARLSLFRAAAPTSRSLSSLTLGRAAILSAAQSVSVLPRAGIALTAQRTYMNEQRTDRKRWTDPRGAEGPSEPSSSVFVGNMPWSMSKTDLEDLFSEFGEIESVRLQTHADGRPRGFAHVTFVDKESAVALVNSSQQEPLHVSGRDLVVDYARRPAGTYTEQEPNERVYFGKFGGDESELRELLAEFNDAIVDVFFMRNGDTGERTNSGFIQFTDTTAAGEVIAKFNGQTLEDGVELRLAYARARKEGPRQERPPRRGHYTNRRYNSGRGEGSRDRDY